MYPFGKTAIITLCEKGLATSRKIKIGIAHSELYVHEFVSTCDSSEHTFSQVVLVSKSLFSSHRNLIFVLPTGVAVRAIAELVESKYSDPAVVVVDVGGRWAISLLSGHEGGANELAMTVSNILDAEPVISTTSEAEKSLLVGVGCRKGTHCCTILDAITETLEKFHLLPSDLRLLASVDIKKSEQGLLDAAKNLHVPVRFVSASQITECSRNIQHSSFVEQKVGLPGVAEPAALLAGRRTTLLVPKQTFQAVTVAVAKENCSW